MADNTKLTRIALEDRLREHANRSLSLEEFREIFPEVEYDTGRELHNETPFLIRLNQIAVLCKGERGLALIRLVWFGDQYEHETSQF